MNRIITCLLSGVSDPQREEQWKVDHSYYSLLLSSCKEIKIHLTVLSDSLEETEEEFLSVVRTESKINPYFQRWKSIGDYLGKTDFEKVYCVDATDVVVLNDPFEMINPSNLVVGSEASVLSNKWIILKHKNEGIYRFLRNNVNEQLLNAGVLGGTKENILSFCKEMNALYEEFGDDYTDMPRFNYVCREKSKLNLEYGSHINTLFKGYELENDKPLFRHK